MCRLFRSLVLIYAPYRKGRESDRDNSQVDPWLLASFAYVNRMDLVLCTANTGECWQKADYFDENERFILQDVNKRQEQVHSYNMEEGRPLSARDDVLCPEGQSH
jgi:hypothetical protein